jgi:ubiquinone/menaquinone biosynthesis C-methylase UbiE
MKSAHRTSLETRVCPWWFIHAFDNPVRRLFQKPETILQGLVRPGDVCLDVGCGYGYFTIPMARLVGSSGAVVAADLQPEMLAGVKRRAESAGVLAQIRLLNVDSSGLQFESAFDFALAFWMVHEVPDQEALLRQIRMSLTPAGRFLMVEPVGHVSKASFTRTVGFALQAGFTPAAEPRVSLSRAVLLTCPSSNLHPRAQ